MIFQLTSPHLRLKSGSAVDLSKLSNDNGSETDEIISSPGMSAGTSVKSFDMGAKDKGDSKEQDEEQEDDEMSLVMPTLFFEEPAPLDGEMMRATCQLISLVRTVPGWFAVTSTSLHFLQNHAEPVTSEIDVAGNGRRLTL